jgi:hypothetical protein
MSDNVIFTVLWWIIFVLILTVFLKLGLILRGIVPRESLPTGSIVSPSLPRRLCCCTLPGGNVWSLYSRGWTVRQLDKLRHARVLHTNRHDGGRLPCIVGHCSGMESAITETSSSIRIIRSGKDQSHSAGPSALEVP